jgi:hypothetical protein
MGHFFYNIYTEFIWSSNPLSPECLNHFALYLCKYDTVLGIKAAGDFCWNKSKETEWQANVG